MFVHYHESKKELSSWQCMHAAGRKSLCGSKASNYFLYLYDCGYFFHFLSFLRFPSSNLHSHAPLSTFILFPRYLYFSSITVMAIQSRDSSQEEHHPPTVLIVGGGLAGLLLAILLEHIEWPYQIFERAEAVKPIGSTLAVSPNILAVIEQIGIYEDLPKASVRGVGMTLYNEQLKKVFSTGLSTIKEL